ncbi:DUF6415 family natural product biosynthesis protein [Streptomyces sp. CA-100214]
MPEPQDMRTAWTAVLDLTGGLPGTIPRRTELEAPVAALRVHVEGLVREVEALLDDDEDSVDQETGRWLLMRVRRTLTVGDGDDRHFATAAEDLALSCRALAALPSALTPCAKR